MPLACEDAVPATSQIPRLSAAEYDRTIRDLLGVTTLDDANASPPSTFLTSDTLGEVTGLAWAGYLAAAEAVAAQVFADPALKTRFLDCAPNVESSACLHDTIVRFGRRAFRRPLSAGEVARFEATGARASELTEHGTLDEVAELILQTFLVSPSFLQRAELTETADQEGNYVLSSFEVASRLSYFLWGSMPDEALEQAADTQGLRTVPEIRQQAVRMLADPRAREQVKALHRYYLGLRDDSPWSLRQKSAERFPSFTATSASAAAEETDRFFESVVVDQGGTFADLFTSPLAFVNAASAPLYGLDPAAYGDALERAMLDAAERPGFLTRVQFLAAFSHYEETSPQLRGGFIARELLGVPFGVHPEDALVMSVPADPALDTMRKKAAALDGAPTCVPCHTLVDPLGFVLEAFDAVGVRQTADFETGAPIDTEADVDIDGEVVHVKNAAELMRRLAVSRDARRRYAERWVSFAYGREADHEDTCVVDRLAEQLSDQAYRALEVPADLATTAPFRIRRVEVP